MHVLEVELGESESERAKPCQNACRGVEEGRERRGGEALPHGELRQRSGRREGEAEALPSCGVGILVWLYGFVAA